ncbi:phage portal protein [Ligilactobacillus salivarius]|uniref:Phage portal protein n=1 Tax=Ligilactobacillus salivarius TaxID=1624 RepID=A0AAW7N6J6_9LACO|nr:phage portal protein [Ligilactobacillus salivarius]MDN4833734.1 phage portal protein [Ligilactobacillus salivarius]
MVIIINKITIGRGQVVKGDVFIFPKGETLNVEDLYGFIQYQDELYRRKYEPNYDMYVSNHPILRAPLKAWSENNKLVVPMPRLLVDEYAGYFGGNAPTVQLEDETDNDSLQVWLNDSEFADEHSEIVKAVGIYGRSYLLAYQGEDSKPKIAHVEPDEGFMIYDDTIKSEPLAFVRYSRDYLNHVTGTIYYAGFSIDFKDDKLEEPVNYVWHEVPAVEFYSNEERQGIFDGVKTLIEALDKALSKKADQVDYFDNAYLLALGLNLEDENGRIHIDREQRFIYSPDADATNAKVEFIGKPDADGMQENLINRLIDLIYYTSMIPNLQDSAFSGNSSGVALQFKLLPMQNMAAFQERKFIKSLRRMFKVLFESADGGQIVRAINKDSWLDLRFTYTRNMPQNMADAVSTAVQASSLLSQQTALAMIPGIDDPQAEIKRKEDEQSNSMKKAMNQALPDYLKAGVDNDEENSEE